MKKLFKALHIIQDECKEHRSFSCTECPMWSDECGVCCVTDLEPHDWEINDNPEKALL